ncbi:copper chaperone PCu(A)C [Gordonia aurantiaca]|uniref:copper chaperone PCu(A)C n=1 Tax=Gordonia sp. B21 TaxID=3151852 RepID=UPI003265AC3D
MFASSSTMRRARRPLVMLAVLALPLSVATACGSDDEPKTQAESVTIGDQWVKASDKGMTGAFGKLTNTSDEEVTLTGGDSDVAGRVEVHEMAPNADGSMSMRQVDGGLTIAGGQTLTLEPGGNHIMLMDLKGPIKAGETVTITLRFGDGSQRDLVADARDFRGANEEYAPGHGSGDASDG